VTPLRCGATHQKRRGAKHDAAYLNEAKVKGLGLGDSRLWG
jgi:hypothetical protein